MTTMRLPIQFNSDSYSIDTIADGTDEYYISILSFTMRIEQGELPLSTSYGVSDPTFQETSPISVVNSASRFVPEIRILDTKVTRNDSGLVGVSVQFERQD